MLYIYNSSPVFDATEKRLTHEATQLLERLRQKRNKVSNSCALVIFSTWLADKKQCNTRPPMFIGHNLGGILIKQAVVNAHNLSRYNEIAKATFAVVCMPTPHGGSQET
jgi:hypothetical protein